MIHHTLHGTVQETTANRLLSFQERRSRSLLDGLLENLAVLSNLSVAGLVVPHSEGILHALREPVDLLQLTSAGLVHAGVDARSAVGLSGLGHLEAVLHNGELVDVHAGLHDVELDELPLALLLVRNGIQDVSVRTVNVADVGDPVLERAGIVLLVESDVDALAGVVSADDDVLDLQVVNSVLEGTHQVHIEGKHDVGHVAADEDFTGLSTDDLVSGNTGVSRADPEDLGLVDASEPVEELGGWSRLNRLDAPCLVGEPIEFEAES